VDHLKLIFSYISERSKLQIHILGVTFDIILYSAREVVWNMQSSAIHFKVVFCVTVTPCEVTCVIASAVCILIENGDLKEKCMPCSWRLARRLLQETAGHYNDIGVPSLEVEKHQLMMVNV
jgi:uncharacterized paraquat-inducible protein A